MRKSRVQAREQEVAEQSSSKDTLKIPHDPIGESAIIAAVIVSADARRRYLSLPSQLFVHPGHDAIWDCLQQIFGRGLSYDPVTVRQLSGGKIDPALIDGYLAARPELPPNLSSFVDHLRWDAVRVGVAKTELPELLEAMRDHRADPDKVRSLAKRLASAFDGVGTGRLRRSTEQIIAEHRETLTKRRQGQAHFPFGIEGLDLYGAHDFDERHRDEQGRPRNLSGTPRLIPGAARGMTTVVTGVSGSGKTTSVTNSVLAWANAGQFSLWGAWEVKDAMNLEALAVRSLGWHRSDAITGDFTEAEQEELLAEMERLGEFVKFLDLPFDRKRGTKSTNDQNLDLIQQEISDVGPDHFIADLFQRALVQTKPEEESRAVNRFQAMMQEEKCHGVIVHQLNIKSDKWEGSDKRPTPETLKGSGSYYEVADTVLAWYRPSFYKSVPDTTVECHILKQRYGKYPQVVELDWDPEFGTIDNGRTIEVERPGDAANAQDNFLGEALKGKVRAKRRRLG